MSETNYPDYIKENGNSNTQPKKEQAFLKLSIKKEEMDHLQANVESEKTLNIQTDEGSNKKGQFTLRTVTS